MIKLKNILNEGIEFQAILVKDATVKYNTPPAGGIPGVGTQMAGQSYAKVPKGTFLIGLPGGLFAVNMKKKFAMALTSGSREWLGAQDKLKGNEVGGTNMAPEYKEWKKYLNESVNESMIGITTDKSFKPADLQKALDKAKIKGYKMDRLSMTLTALKLDKKYFNDAKKLIDDLGLSVMMAKESNLFELSSQQDGTKDSNGKHKHEDHIEEDIEALWKKTYGEDFVKHYPAIVKIIRQRKIKDKREIARIWQDTYGEDFEKEYPALYNKL